LPQVTVIGRIVGSDQPTVGLADASINLTGYANYQVTTNASGQFTINNVYANHTYNYLASCSGYQNATGTVDVGSTNVNMGDIILNELAYPPNPGNSHRNSNPKPCFYNLAYSPSSTNISGVVDFELNDGGWVPSSKLVLIL
jgi:hypothetical protein